MGDPVKQDQKEYYKECDECDSGKLSIDWNTRIANCDKCDNTIAVLGLRITYNGLPKRDSNMEK